MATFTEKEETYKYYIWELNQLTVLDSKHGPLFRVELDPEQEKFNRGDTVPISNYNLQPMYIFMQCPNCYHFGITKSYRGLPSLFVICRTRKIPLQRNPIHTPVIVLVTTLLIYPVHSQKNEFCYNLPLEPE